MTVELIPATMNENDHVVTGRDPLVEAAANQSNREQFPYKVSQVSITINQLS
jgi:hypothetical protein